MANRTAMTFKKLNSFIKDVETGNIKELLEKLQAMQEYQAEKLDTYEEKIQKLTGKTRPSLNDSDKRRLAHKGKMLNVHILSTIEPT